MCFRWYCNIYLYSWILTLHSHLFVWEASYFSCFIPPPSSTHYSPSIHLHGRSSNVAENFVPSRSEKGAQRPFYNFVRKTSGKLTRVRSLAFLSFSAWCAAYHFYHFRHSFLSIDFTRNLSIFLALGNRSPIIGSLETRLVGGCIDWFADWYGPSLYSNWSDRLRAAPSHFPTSLCLLDPSVLSACSDDRAAGPSCGRDRPSLGHFESACSSKQETS